MCLSVCVRASVCLSVCLSVHVRAFACLHIGADWSEPSVSLKCQNFMAQRGMIPNRISPLPNSVVC